jgi:hypothetical protein
MRSRAPSRRPRSLALCLLLAGALAGCGKETKLEAGAVLLELRMTGGVTTPDELRLSVYDDNGTLWKDSRVPGTGALVPESAARLGTVLIQPGAAQGKLRVHARGFAVAARVADGTLEIAGGARGTFTLTLEGVVPIDDDGDDVPDAIDDCTGMRNPDQGGCPGGNGDGGGGSGGSGSGGGGSGGGGGGSGGGGNDGGSDDVAPGDGGGMDAAPGCDATGGCDRPVGTACTDGTQCRSSFCVDNVCCANACIGPCRSCNQPNNDGTCMPYAQGTNPAGECTGGMTCNGAGACGPPAGGPKANGDLCAAGNECASTFCKDGVCCNNACDGACRSCETGTCMNVTRKVDPPECYGNMTCNAAAKCVVN